MHLRQSMCDVIPSDVSKAWRHSIMTSRLNFERKVNDAAKLCIKIPLIQNKEDSSQNNAKEKILTKKNRNEKKLQIFCRLKSKFLISWDTFSLCWSKKLQVIRRQAAVLTRSQFHESKVKSSSWWNFSEL